AGLYAGESETAEAGVESFAGALAWLGTNAQADTAYIYLFGADEEGINYVLNSSNLASRTGVTLTLKGTGGERTLQLSAGGTATQSLITVQSGVTLQLAKNITLMGRESGYQRALVFVNGGTIELYDGAKICGHKNNNGSGNMGDNNAGGVFVNGGAFLIKGGEISGNQGRFGGGANITCGTLIVDGGLITNNKALNGAGGLDFCGGTSSISGGEIRGNISQNGTVGTGGGIQVKAGTVTMSGGLITENEANGTGDDGGGGVMIYGGTFNLTGGVIESNTTTSTKNASAQGSFNLRRAGGSFSFDTYPDQNLITAENGFKY
ncbi:MAG: hypothetical protein LBC77_02825, partial [Spirochaetaceae bacterium]|nr:hypothetical protein [Spirochaetaceae bacterium]